MTGRPGWFREDLFPFESRFLEVRGARVHYVDEGSGPTILMLHGNPTWSFLYRGVILGLRDRFRCVALDYPGFGLSTAPPGYRYTVGEHRDVVEAFVRELDLTSYTPMVQDWGGPIGMSVATRDPDRVRALVIGNTWAWPMSGAFVRAFSWTLGGPLGHLLVRRADVFTRVFVPGGHRRRKLSAGEMAMYEGPHPTPASRAPVHVMPREILAATPMLAEVEAGITELADRPALIVWATEDRAFRKPERERWESLLPDHRTVLLEGAGHYFPDDAPDEVVAAVRDWFPA